MQVSSAGRSALRYRVGQMILAFLLASPVTEVLPQQGSRGAWPADVRTIEQRRILIMGGEQSRYSTPFEPTEGQPRRESPKRTPLLDDRRMMPVFPETGPSTPLVVPPGTPGVGNLAAAKDECGRAVEELVNNTRSPALRRQWYDACTATQLPSDFNVVDNAAVGLAEEGSPKVFCSGVLKDATTLVTARHCFFDERSGEAKPQWDVLMNNRVEARSPLGRFKISCGGRRPEIFACVPRLRGGFGLSRDMIFLAVEGVPQSFTGLDFGTTKIGDELLLFSHFDSGQTRRYSKTGCRVQAISGSCVVHGCQADHTSSGGPLFFRDNNVLKIAGIHLSGATESRDCGFNSVVTSNVGLLIRN